MSKRCKLQKEYYKEFGNYKGSGKYTDHYVNWLESKVLAINYTHCSTQLKDKYGEDFAYFVEKKVNARKIEDVYYYDDKLFLCADDLFKEYQKLTKPLIF